MPRFMAFAAAMTIAAIAVVTSACGSGSSESAATTTVASNSVPATTQKVYLATALACRYLGTDQGEGVAFKPLKVTGRSYSVSIDPTDDCQEQRIFNSYLYDVPTPASGTIRITPGNQPAAVLDAAKLTKSGVATVFYAREGKGKYEVSVIRYEKDDEVKDAVGGGSSTSEYSGPKLTGYAATKDDFAEGKESDTDKEEGCCFLPKQADGSDRWYDVKYDDNDRVFTYSMSFAPTIVIAGAQNVILGELPPDAKLVFTVNRRDCKMMQYRSALVRKALQGRWDVLVSLYSGDTAKPYNDLAISDILFSNNTPGDRSIQC